MLVTSRRHLGDLPGVVVPMLLEALPPGQAREMFLRLAPRAAEPETAVRTGRLAGYLPLAICLLARVYARHPSWTLADLAPRPEASLLTLVAEKDSVAAAFEMSYRYLPPRPAAVLPPPGPASGHHDRCVRRRCPGRCPAAGGRRSTWTRCTARAC